MLLQTGNHEGFRDHAAKQGAFLGSDMARGCAAIGLAGAKAPHFFQRIGLKFLQTEKLLFGEVEVICFDVFLKKL